VKSQAKGEILAPGLGVEQELEAAIEKAPSSEVPVVLRTQIMPAVSYRMAALYRRLTDPDLPLAERLSAGDELDRLGWLPEDLYTFVSILGSSVPFSIARYPVTNIQYQRFLEAEDYADPQFWRGFPKYDENCKLLGYFGEEGWQWLQKNWNKQKRRLPGNWKDPKFGFARRGTPVVGVTWYEANAYCKWLQKHWAEMGESRQDPDQRLKQVRLPIETEWILAAGGAKAPERFPWDAPGKATQEIAEILRRANVSVSGLGCTTPVGMYPLGASPYGVWDMAGNVWEWQMNFYDKDHDYMALRGSAWNDDEDFASLPYKSSSPPDNYGDAIGFRVCVLHS
jgi:formylglycine-generating enzyme required for sulfatase activity